MTTTPAETLRAAVEKLRALTTHATSGPWLATPDILVGGWAVAQAPLARPDGPYLADFVREEDARYIATMHPGVGAALADWLEATAEHLAVSTHPDWQDTVAALPLAVARQILGSQP
ncbi:hypothetical protein [Streptomyces sp. DH12]|uniref:hypothetical protein n=1 Tax=Streptomyces sp. DH12 TaxID=2857010 RepID=UPI001E5BCD65|nr:hypothetical protein [Streptomyces sp. DH12]